MEDLKILKTKTLLVSEEGCKLEELGLPSEESLEWKPIYIVIDKINSVEPIEGDPSISLINMSGTYITINLDPKKVVSLITK